MKMRNSSMDHCICTTGKGRGTPGAVSKLDANKKRPGTLRIRNVIKKEEPSCQGHDGDAGEVPLTYITTDCKPKTRRQLH